MTNTANDADYLVQYISEISSQDKISNSPLLVIDGFPINYFDYKEKAYFLTKSDIKEIDYLSKDSKTAKNLYGERARGGVLLIMTNKTQEKSAKSMDDSNVLLLLGNKQISKEELENLDPEVIEKIEVIKNVDDIKKYTSEDYDGVVIVTMKKWNEFSKHPILVIDGIEYVDIQEINLRKIGLQKADIKKNELLKKESAIRIFGDEGERGVLLITSKADSIQMDD